MTCTVAEALADHADDGYESPSQGTQAAGARRPSCFQNVVRISKLSESCFVLQQQHVFCLLFVIYLGAEMRDHADDGADVKRLEEQVRGVPLAFKKIQ